MFLTFVPQVTFWAKLPFELNDHKIIFFSSKLMENWGLQFHIDLLEDHSNMADRVSMALNLFTNSFLQNCCYYSMLLK